MSTTETKNGTGKLYEYIFVSLSIIGGILIATKVHAKLGFGFFLASNVASVPFGIYYKHWGVIALNVIYAAIDTYAILTW